MRFLKGQIMSMTKFMKDKKEVGRRKNENMQAARSEKGADKEPVEA